MNFLEKLFNRTPATEILITEDRCEGCHWKTIKRHQKCSCCRRNANQEEPAE